MDGATVHAMVSQDRRSRARGLAVAFLVQESSVVGRVVGEASSGYLVRKKKQFFEVKIKRYSTSLFGQKKGAARMVVAEAMVDEERGKRKANAGEVVLTHGFVWDFRLGFLDVC